jgi:hypothetical protein
MENKASISCGGGTSGLLLVAFIVLKLMHLIDWSWWWVLAPMWIPIMILLIVLMASLIIAATVK